MQQNVVPLENVPPKEWKQQFAFKEICQKHIFPPCPFLIYFCVESAHRLLDADAATAKFQLKSVQKQSVKLLVFFCSSKVMQCHIYTQNNRPFTILFFLLKKNHTVHFCAVSPGGKTMERLRRASVVCQLWSPSIQPR